MEWRWKLCYGSQCWWHVAVEASSTFCRYLTMQFSYRLSGERGGPMRPLGKGCSARSRVRVLSRIQRYSTQPRFLWKAQYQQRCWATCLCSELSTVSGSFVSLALGCPSGNWKIRAIQGKPAVAEGGSPLLLRINCRIVRKRSRVAQQSALWSTPPNRRYERRKPSASYLGTSCPTGR